MSKSYIPGPEADAIIDRQVAKGSFASAEEVIRAGVELLEQQDEELAELRRQIAEGDEAYARGEYTKYDSADELLADIKLLGEKQLRRKT
jgi:putative addiction module CopG family antidote